MEKTKEAKQPSIIGWYEELKDGSESILIHLSNDETVRLDKNHVDYISAKVKPKGYEFYKRR